MRVTRELLIKAAQGYVDEQVNTEHSLLCAYLCGSVLEDEPLLGEAGDIDLIFIHYHPPQTQRQIIRLNDQIHLDIVHHAHSQYSQPRNLRLNSWLGPTIYNCKVLYDPQHFMDFTVAGVRGQFNLSESIAQRSRSQYTLGRTIWAEIAKHNTFDTPQLVMKYLDVIEKAINAIACLNGAPLTERRLLVQFPAVAETIGQPGLYIGALGLLGGLSIQREVILQWLEPWEKAYKAANIFPNAPFQIHPHRLLYYRSAIQYLIDYQQPASALYPLLHTWTLIACSLQKDNYHQEAWRNICQYLALYGDALEERVAALDAYLDTIEEIIENWCREQGV